MKLNYKPWIYGTLAIAAIGGFLALNQALPNTDAKGQRFTMSNGSRVEFSNDGEPDEAPPTTEDLRIRFHR